MPVRLFLSSGDLIADRRFEFARDLQLKGDLGAAADLLTQAVELAPNFASAWFTLGEIRVKLGEKDAAIAEGKLAVALLPESQDALDGPKMTLALAQIYAWTGENDSAFELLERSLTTPAGVTVSSLKLNPVWDPLRADGRFQALIDVAQNPEVKLSMNCKQSAIH